MNNETTTRSWISKLPVAMTIASLRPQINVNENSDMNGRPKTCEVGGTTRTRISSQHGKHGMRLFENFSPLLDSVQERLTQECSDAIHVEADRRSRLWPQAICRAAPEARRAGQHGARVRRRHRRHVRPHRPRHHERHHQRRHQRQDGQEDGRSPEGHRPRREVRRRRQDRDRDADGRAQARRRPRRAGRVRGRGRGWRRAQELVGPRRRVRRPRQV